VIIQLTDALLLFFLVITGVMAVRLRDLFAVAMLTGVFSLLSAGLFVTLDAPDVAFTEAAVGAGISTVLILGTLALTRRREKSRVYSRVLPLAVVTLTGAALIYGSLDLPHFGDPAAPIHHHVAPHYIEATPREIGVPNIVTAVLASFRGFDTLGEVVVIFTAGIGVLLLLGHRFDRAGAAGTDDRSEEETRR
jgi:multicomponent Na+:H+ antiporter subunit B